MTLKFGTHIMVDIETMGTGADAALVQIGAVAFRPGDGDGTVDVDGGFRANIDLGSPRVGQFEGSTIKWWLGQESEAISKVLLDGPRRDFYQAIAAFDRWVQEQKADFIWGNAPTFDLTILRAAFKRADLKFPMGYRQEVCFRTLRQLGRVMGMRPPKFEGVRHDGLDDAIFQAKGAIEILGRIGE